MSRVVALEWDGCEVRMIVGTVSGNSVAIEHIISQDLPSRDSDDAIDAAQLTPIIRGLAARAGVSGGEILVSVARGRVELRNLQLPKADSNELPGMVRFTAMRQFANVGDTWPIDFAPLPNSVQSDQASDLPVMQEVVAMTMSPAVVSQIKKACSDAGFTVTQIGLRPMASGTLAAAVANSPVGADSTVLLIDVLKDEADMVLLERGYVSFMRTVRLSKSGDGGLGLLPLGEIRRTLLAAVSARPGLKIDRIILWSDPATAEPLLNVWQPQLDLPVEAINPLSLVDLRKSVQPTRDTGRFAPLIGMLLQRRQTAKVATGNTFIDFLHPRQKLEKKKPIRQYALVTLAGLLLVGGSLWAYREKHRRLDEEIAELTAKLKDMEPTLKLAQKYSSDWKKVERFLAGDIQWLDELSYLSKRSPPPDQMVVKGLTNFSVNAVTNVGVITTSIGLTDQKLQPEVEGKVRDPNHQIGTKGVKRSPEPNTPYRWTVDPEILISPAKVIDPTTLPPLPKPANSDSKTTITEEAPRT